MNYDNIGLNDNLLNVNSVSIPTIYSQNHYNFIPTNLLNMFIQDFHMTTICKAEAICTITRGLY